MDECFHFKVLDVMALLGCLTWSVAIIYVDICPLSDELVILRSMFYLCVVVRFVALPLYVVRSVEYAASQ